MQTDRQLTILFDNVPGSLGLQTLWGFAALIETPAGRMLFDTGSNGRVLLTNMAALGIDPASLDWMFLSHTHWDHIGGFDSILELNPGLKLVVHEGFSKHLINDLASQCRELIVVGHEPQMLAPGLYSTGMLTADPPEQALVIASEQSVAVISGCAHPGMERIVAQTKAFLRRDVDWAVGGFHLMYADAPRIEESIHALQGLGVSSVVPTHCTGDAARSAFAKAYGDRCIGGGVGSLIRID